MLREPWKAGVLDFGIGGAEDDCETVRMLLAGRNVPWSSSHIK